MRFSYQVIRVRLGRAHVDRKYVENLFWQVWLVFWRHIVWLLTMKVMHSLFRLNLRYIYWNFVFSVIKRFYFRVNLITSYYFLVNDESFFPWYKWNFTFYFKAVTSNIKAVKCIHAGEGGDKKTKKTCVRFIVFYFKFIFSNKYLRFLVVLQDRKDTKKFV